MEYRTLADTKKELSVIGMGTWPLAGYMGEVDRKQADSLIRQAIDSGINLIDTAEAYGDSEVLCGNALSGGYRERCFLATKVSIDFSKAGVKNALENSLRKLKTDFIDLYQIHRYDPDTELEETMEAIVRLQEEGKIRYIGVSNFTVEQCEEAEHYGEVKANQINYNALNRSPEEQMLSYCKEKNIGVLVHSSLAKGLLSGKYKPGHRFRANDERSDWPSYKGEALKRYLSLVDELKGPASDFGLSLSQASLLWLLARDEVSTVLIGPKNMEQLSEALESLEKLSIERRKELRQNMDEIIRKHNLSPLCPFKEQLV